MLLFQSLVAGTLGLLRTRLGLGEGFRAFVSAPHFRPGGKECTNPPWFFFSQSKSGWTRRPAQPWIFQTPTPMNNLQRSISQGSLHPTHLPLTHTVVADTAVWGPGWPKHLASETVLQLHHLPVDHHLPSSRRWPVRGTACVVWGWEERWGTRETSGQISGKQKLG